MNDSRDRGQALVEFALVIPIILLLMVGLFDLGRVVFINNSLSDGARHGARHAATDPRHDDYCDDIDAAVRSAVRGLALTTYTVTLATVDGSGNVLSSYLVCQNGSDGSGKSSMEADRQVSPGDRVTVVLEADVDLAIGFIARATGRDAFSLHAESTMHVTFAPKVP